jgi:hemolysin III
VVTSDAKPRFRGIFHEWAFFASLGAGALLLVLSRGGLETVSTSVYIAALAAMFGASALYHRVTWSSPAVRAWMRRVDHSMIFVFIAGSYTPFALLTVRGTLGWAMLIVAWVGAVIGIVFSLAWIHAPSWAAAALYLALGWIGVVAAPRLASGAGLSVVILVAAGGLLYTAGAIAYAAKRPDPWPATFGYHEIFHLLVVAAVVAQFVAVALVVG